jgi:hypothetical protein
MNSGTIGVKVQYPLIARTIDADVNAPLARATALRCRGCSANTRRAALTMEYLPGPHLDEFLESDPSQAERDRFR